MESKTHRSGTKTTFRDAWIRTFGSSVAVPSANARVKVAIAILALLGTGAAAAAWQVNDPETQRAINDHLDSNGTVTVQIKNLNRKLQITRRVGTTPAIVEPTDEEALHATQPSTTVVTMGQLCTTGAQTMLGEQQHRLCQDLARTELAQYRFSLRMFERAEQNYERLRQIEEHRRSLGDEDYANIQQNTNEILALTALMDNDRDRYQTYMAAYDARIAHIRNSQTALTRNALKGSGSLSLASL